MNRLISLAFMLLLTASGLFSGNNSSTEFRLLSYLDEDLNSRTLSSELRNDLQRLKDLKVSREMLYRSKNPLKIANGLRHINMNEKEIFSGYKKTENKGILKISSSGPNDKNKAVSFLSSLNINSIGSKKTAFQGVMKHQLDSFVNEMKELNTWKKTDKNYYRYDNQGRMTEYHYYEPDAQSQSWKEYNKGNMAYNNHGHITLTESYEWNDATSQWYLDWKSVMSFNEQELPVLIEEYTDDYNLDSARFIRVGLNKSEFEYDVNGMPTKIIFYMWDSQTSSWIPESKNELKIENDRELMFASYTWDSNLNIWIGDWKFEHIPIPNFDLMDYIKYGWDSNTNSWYADMKEENVIQQDADGLRVLKNYYEAHKETLQLLPVTRTVYSKPFINNYFDEDNFKLVMGYQYNSEIASWVNTTKTENTFHTSGLISLSSEFEWLFTPAANTHTWIEVFRVESTIGANNTITNAVNYNWRLNPGSGNYELAWRDSYQFSYVQIGNEFFNNAWTKQSQNTGSDIWENAEKYDAMFNNQGQIINEQYSNYEFATNEWIPNRKSEYAYNHDESYALYATYSWNRITSAWQLNNKSEFYIDEYDRVLKESNSYYAQAVDQVITTNLEERTYLGGPDDNRLTMESFISSQMQFDGQNFFVEVQGEKEEWNYETSGDKSRIANNIRYRYENNNFYPAQKTVFTYHENHFEALILETFYNYYDNTPTGWEVKGKGEVAYNFNFSRDNLVLPFGSEDDDAYLYFAYMPTSYYESDWNSESSTWNESNRNTLYFSEKEFAAIDKLTESGSQVYPNPVKDILYISNSNHSGTSKVTISDLQGRILIEKNLINSNQINLSGLNTGIYFYQIIDENKTSGGKFMKE